MPVTNYIWDVVSDNVLMEKDDDDETIARYVQEPSLYGEAISQERDGETRYYHYDGEGNTSELTDENENVTDTYEYSAFGEEIARNETTENPFGYKGALGYYTNGEMSDVYVRARTYQPRIARWLTIDPMRADVCTLFAYVANDPVNNADPTGCFGVSISPQLSAAGIRCMDGCGKVSMPIQGKSEGYVSFWAWVTGDSCATNSTNSARVHFRLFTTTAMIERGRIKCGLPAQAEITDMRTSGQGWGYSPNACGLGNPRFSWLDWLPFFDSDTRERCHSGLWEWDCPVTCKGDDTTCAPRKFTLGLHGIQEGLSKNSLYTEAEVDWELCCSASCDIKAKWIWYNNTGRHVLLHPEAQCGYTAAEVLEGEWPPS